MTITYHRDVKEVQSDSALARLLSADEQRAPFDRLAWWAALVEHCGVAPLVCVARDADGCAVLALREQAHGHLHALANWYTFRFRPVGAEDDALLAALARDLRRRARRITLHGVPDEDGSAARLARAFCAGGWHVAREACDTNHTLAVAGRDYESYFAARPGKLRTTIKRKAGKLETQVFDRFDGGAWAEYENVYARSWKPEEGSPAFLRAFAEAEGSAGRLRLGIARHDRQAIAAQVWTVEGGTAWIHKLAYVDETRALSPGSVLTAALMRHVIDRDRVETVDFGTGDDPYKADWMEAQRPRYRLAMLDPRAPANWPLLVCAAVKARLAARAKRG